MQKHWMMIALVFGASYLQGQDSQRELDRWVEALKSDAGTFEGLYTSDFEVIVPEGTGYVRFNDVKPKDLYNELLGEPVDSIWSLFDIKASRSVDYEIVKFRTSKAAYFQMIIWNRASGDPLRELEVLSESGMEGPAKIPKMEQAMVEIAQARVQWVELCNSHAPANLVAAMYTPNALYYNHRPMVVGRQAITETYGYMANPNYELDLTPWITQVVSENMAFEIGYCTGSYGGKYMLVWVKNSEGKWQVLLDSNI